MTVRYLGHDDQYGKSEDSAAIVIMPVPYDGTCTWIKGADKGPAAILEASANMEVYDIETQSEVYRQGIYTTESILDKDSPESMVDAVYNKAQAYLKEDKFLVTIGGEHSVSIGPIQAYAEKYPDLTVLQFDAHSDTREEYMGSKYNHACVMARAREQASIIQVGVRSMDVSETTGIDRSRVFYRHQIFGNDHWHEDLLKLLTGHVYITIDLDVFDPSIMPSVGTPEPDGMLYHEVLRLIKKVNRKTTIVGFDVVELCPNATYRAADFIAAKLIYQILSLKFHDTC